jgi:hypothetical protein
MEWQTGVAIYAAIVATIVLLIQVATFSRDSDDLELSISHGLAMGTLEVRLGTDRIIQVTVTSRGGRPVGVSSLFLSLTKGKSTPLFEHLPVDGSRTLPTVLNRGEFATYWLNTQSTREALQREGVRIVAVGANLTDGRTVSKKVSSTWRRFGDPGS